MNPLETNFLTPSYPSAASNDSTSGQAAGPPLPIPLDTGAGADTASSPQAGASGTGARASGSGSQTAAQLLAKHFDQALRNTGVKAEIQIEKGVGMVVRLVQSGTGKLVMQLPPQGVIELVAQVQRQQDKEMGIAPPAAPVESGDDTGGGSGGLIDQMA